MTNPPFGFDEPEHSPGFLLWQTTIKWQRLIKKALEPHGISHGQFVLMAILLWWQGKQVHVTQSILIKMSKLDKMTVSISLKKCAAMDLVTRQENPEDSRAKSVCLTPSGATLIKQIIPMIESIDGQFFGRLRNADEASLIKHLNTLANDT